MKKITYDMLVALDACEPQREAFIEKFGDELVLTLDMDFSVAVGMDVDWIAEQLFSSDEWDRYLTETGADRDALYAERDQLNVVYLKAVEPHKLVQEALVRPVHEAMLQAITDRQHGLIPLEALEYARKRHREVAAEANAAFNAATKDASDTYCAGCDRLNDALTPKLAEVFVRIYLEQPDHE